MSEFYLPCFALQWKPIGMELQDLSKQVRLIERLAITKQDFLLTMHVWPLTECSLLTFIFSISSSNYKCCKLNHEFLIFISAECLKSFPSQCTLLEYPLVFFLLICFERVSYSRIVFIHYIFKFPLHCDSVLVLSRHLITVGAHPWCVYKLLVHLNHVIKLLICQIELNGVKINPRLIYGIRTPLGGVVLRDTVQFVQCDQSFLLYPLFYSVAPSDSMILKQS